jgi:hypothetical protein
MAKSRPRPISSSALQPPAPVRFLLTRVMREILASGTILMRGDQSATVDLDKLRIVIGKGMAIAHRMGVSAGRDEMQSRRRT